jgi:hypothetical protein
MGPGRAGPAHLTALCVIVITIVTPFIMFVLVRHHSTLTQRVTPSIIIT